MSLPIAPINMDPKNYERLDAPLIALTNACGGDLRRMLFAFFSFLHRRTDFYLVPPGDAGPHKMGFKEGDAEKVLLAAFRQFPLRKIPVGAIKKPAAGKEAGAPTAKVASSKDKGKNEKGKYEKEAKQENEKSETNDKSSHGKNHTGKGGDANTSPSEVPPPSKLDETKEVIEKTEDGLQIPVGNGGQTEKYAWTQTLEEVSVLVETPPGTSGKDMDVSFTASKLTVKDKKGKVFVDGPLVEKIRPDESTWSLESGGGVLVITLDKYLKKFWDTVIQGDDRIDTSLVDSKRHISDYDESTQATIRRIMFEQSEKRKKEEAETGS